MFEIAPDLVALLMLAAFVAGLVDAIAGGGGLITVPALLLAGAPPVVALATNKLQGTFGAATATIAYARAGQVRLADQAVMALIAGVCGGAGALGAHLIPADVLRLVMPLILIAVALFFALKPGLSDADRVRRIGAGAFAASVVPLVAAYDGFFGPGAGAFYMLGFVMLAGFGILKATAHTKLLNFSSNLGALMVFALSGSMWWAVGLAMGLSQVAGAWVGSRLALRIGARLIKPLLVVTSTAMAARLLWQVWG